MLRGISWLKNCTKTTALPRVRLLKRTRRGSPATRHAPREAPLAGRLRWHRSPATLSRVTGVSIGRGGRSTHRMQQRSTSPSGRCSFTGCRSGSSVRPRTRRTRGRPSTPPGGGVHLALERLPWPVEDWVLEHAAGEGTLARPPPGRLVRGPRPARSAARASTASTGARSTRPPVRASACSYDFSYVVFVARASAALNASSPSASPRWRPPLPAALYAA